MNDAIVVAIITAFGSIAVASLTFFLTKRHQLKVEWQREKLNHYKVLISSLSDLAVDGTDKTEANMKFALVAPQYVIDTLMAFHDEVKFSNQNRSPEKHDLLLNQLLLAIRKDIGLAKKDRPSSFSFHLIGASPKRRS